jgi:glycosyltransferase involved in cell wall biosynthesis
VTVLVFNQFFFPDAVATSQLLTDVARALVEEGHSVRAICGRGGYAGENGGELPGVSIVRTWALPFGHGAAARVLSYLSYLCGAIWHGLRGPRPDVVVTLTTPPVLSLVGWLVRAARGGRHYIWEMDVYPDIAVELGVLRAGAWWTRGLGWALDAVRRRADGVIVLGESMRERLLGHGIPSERLFVSENWADGEEIQPRAFPPATTLQVLYSGNLGLAHDVETLCGALETLAGDPRFQFTFAGGGPQRGALERFCRERGTAGEEKTSGGKEAALPIWRSAVPGRADRGGRPAGLADQGAAPMVCPTVEFRGYCARDELAASLAGCHVGLVTQKAATVGAVVPSKVYGLMAAGRGVLYVGPGNGTPARLIRRFGCGWHVEPGDVAGLAAVLRRLAEDSGEVEAAGARGYPAFREYYDRPTGVGRIVGILGAARVGAGAALAER